MKLSKIIVLVLFSFVIVSCGGSGGGSSSSSGSSGGGSNVVDGKTIKMLDVLTVNNQTYFTAFEPNFVKIELGETVKFVSTDLSHNAKTDLIPSGASTWDTPISAPSTSVTPTKEGIYIYYCVPHDLNGMYGIIQVGNAVNSQEAEIKINEIITQLPSNQGNRLMQAFLKVQ